MMSEMDENIQSWKCWLFINIVNKIVVQIESTPANVSNSILETCLLSPPHYICKCEQHSFVKDNNEKFWNVFQEWKHWHTHNAVFQPEDFSLNATSEG